MSKSYDLGNKSDMRRFERDLKKSVMNMAREKVAREGIEVDCPHCHAKINVQSGPNVCPVCGGQINVELDI